MQLVRRRGRQCLCRSRASPWRKPVLLTALTEAPPCQEMSRLTKMTLWTKTNHKRMQETTSLTQHGNEHLPTQPMPSPERTG